MPDRDLRAALDLTEDDLDHLGAQPGLAIMPVQTVLTAVWPHITALVLDRAATLAERLADDARADSDHRWSAPAAQGHERAAEWLRWLADELEEDGSPAPAPADPHSREQLAAATWPSRAARRLADDAHPTTRSVR